MKAIVVYPNHYELQKIESAIAETCPNFQIQGFTDPMLAYQYAFNQGPIDYLYTLIEMKRLDGFSLARMLREDNSNLSIYFLSYQEQNERDADKFGCDAFIHLPISTEKLKMAETVRKE